jgi:hypothetical protein
MRYLNVGRDTIVDEKGSARSRGQHVDLDPRRAAHLLRVYPGCIVVVERMPESARDEPLRATTPTEPATRPPEPRVAIEDALRVKYSEAVEVDAALKPLKAAGVVAWARRLGYRGVSRKRQALAYIRAQDPDTALAERP